MEETPFGHYILRRLLGAGGMGQVFEAYDTRTDRVVALKVLAAQSADNPTFRDRFRLESRAVAGLNDPHVIPIHGYGEIDGQLYLDMRLVEGVGVDAVLAQSGPMTPEAAVSVVDQVAGALTAAHAQGLVHRDVKPSNMLMAANGFVYLIDFGIARIATEAGLTSTGAAIGTFAYMAPERLSNGLADARSDVYALTCVLYECLTGTTPYPAASLEQQITAHLTSPPPRPSTVRPEVPVAFDEVIARGLAKDTAQRYQTTADLAAAARQALTAARNLPLAPAPTLFRTPAPLGPALSAVHLPSAPDVLDAETVRAQAGPNAVWREPADSTVPGRTARRSRRTRIILPVLVTVIAVSAGVWYMARPAHSALPNTIEIGGEPVDLAMDPSTHTAYVTDSQKGTVSVIDTDSRTVAATIKVGANPFGVAVDSSSHTAYVTDVTRGAESVSVIDTQTRAVTATISVDAAPKWVAADPTTHAVYVVTNTGRLLVIDPISRTIAATIEIPGGASDLALDPTTHSAYTIGSTSMSIIDLVSRRVTDTVKVGSAPSHIAVDPTAHTAYITDLEADSVSVVDLVSHELTASIKVGRAQSCVVLDPSIRTAYIVNSWPADNSAPITTEEASTVDVIDTTSHAVVTTVKVAALPHAGVRMAVDPHTSVVYVLDVNPGRILLVKG